MEKNRDQDPLLLYLRKPSRARLERAIRAYHAFVWTVARRTAGNEEEAADVCQDVFLKLLVEPPDPAAVGSPAGYLAWRAIGRVRFLERCGQRRKAREMEFLRRVAGAGINEGDVEELRSAIEGLSVELRSAIDLRYLAGLSPPQAAAALGITERALFLRLEKARELLKRRLTPLGIVGCLLLDPTVAPASAPPPTLLPALLRIGELGGALAKPAAAAISFTLLRGAIAMTTKKAVVVAVLAVAFIGGLFLLRDAFFSPDLDREIGDASRPDIASLAPGASPPAAGAAIGEKSPAAPAETAEPEAAPVVPPALEGKVTGRGEEPVPGALVRALAADPWMELIRQDLKDVEDDPVPGLRRVCKAVEAHARAAPRAETDAAGNYRFRALAAGEYLLLVSHPDHLLSSDSRAFVQAGAASRCDVRIDRGLRLAGRVVDGAGNPVAGASVGAQTSERGQMRGLGKLYRSFLDLTEGSLRLEPAAISASDGSFALRGLEPVLLDVKARKAGFLPAVAREAAPGTEDLVVVLTRGVPVVGRLLTASGQPAEGAEITLDEPHVDVDGKDMISILLRDFDVTGELRRAAPAAEDGRFRLESTAPGTYELQARLTGSPISVRKVTVGTEPVDLGDWKLGESLSIQGTLLDVGGSPVSGMQVIAFHSARRAFPRPSRKDAVRGETDARGAFRVDGLPAGPYLVEARDADRGVATTMAEAGRSGVVLRFGGTVLIGGRVLDAADGRPLPGATVAYDSFLSSAPTGEDGVFELKAPRPEVGFNGMFQLQGQCPGYRSWWIQADLKVVPLEIRLQRITVISGTVTDGDGRPVAGAKVWFEVPGLPAALSLFEHADRELSTSSDAEGSFSFRRPDSPRELGIDVVAGKPGVGRARVHLTAPPAGDPWPMAALVLRGLSGVEGRIQGPDGGPIEGAQVRLFRKMEISPQFPKDAALVMSILPPAYFASAYSDSTGAYRLREVDPGSCSMEVVALGRERKIIPGLVIGAELLRLDAVLDHGGTITGTVLDAGGSPAASVQVVAFPEGAAATRGARRSPGDEVWVRNGQKAGAEGAASVQTGSDGGFRLEHLPRGLYRVVARAPGHSMAEGGPIGTGKTLPDLILLEHGRIAGRVLDPGMAPVAEFEVSLKREGKEWVDWQEERRNSRGPLGREGKFSYDDLPPGEYDLAVFTPEYLPYRARIRLESGGEAEVEAILEEGASLVGSVRAADDGRPILGAVVRIEPLGNEDPARMPGLQKTAWTSKDGSFVIRGLPVGRYTFLPGHPDFYLRGNPGGIPFEAPHSGEELVARLDRAGKVRGTVEGLEILSGDGGWYELLLVFVSPSGDERQAAWSTLQAEANGSFEAVSLEPGTYRAELWKVTLANGVPDRSAPARSLGEIEVRAGQTAEFRGSTR